MSKEKAVANLFEKIDLKKELTHPILHERLKEGCVLVVSGEIGTNFFSTVSLNSSGDLYIVAYQKFDLRPEIKNSRLDNMFGSNWRSEVFEGTLSCLKVEEEYTEKYKTLHSHVEFPEPIMSEYVKTKSNTRPLNIENLINSYLSTRRDELCIFNSVETLERYLEVLELVDK